MLRVRTGLSVTLFVTVWLAFCVYCQKLDELKIRRSTRNEIDFSLGRAYRFQREGIRLEKFERRFTFAKGDWISRSNTSFEALELPHSNVQTNRNFRGIARESEDEDLNMIMVKRSRVRDSRMMSFLEERTSPGKRLSRRRTLEEMRMMAYRRTNGNDAEIRRRFRNEQEFSNRWHERLLEKRRMLSRNPEGSRVSERRTRRIDSSRLSPPPIRRRIRESEVSNAVLSAFNFNTVGALLQLLFSKLRENFIAIFLSCIFLLDFVNEVVWSQKSSKIESKKSAFRLDTSTLGKIFA